MDRVYGEGETTTIAAALLADISASENQATIVGLTGDLGAGKTTLVRSIAKSLGVTDTVVSPTFVIAKFYDTTDARWKKLIHIDAYRIEDPKELEILGWQKMIEAPNTLIVVEWPERIKEILPENTIHYSIEHRGEERRIVKE